MKRIVATILPMALAACSPQPAEPPASAAAESAAVSMASEQAGSASVVAASDFSGKWNGPEGTSLDITPEGNTYRLVITDLDGPREFTGTAADGGIQFMRDNATLVIRKGSGEETGMKWLAGKTNCVVVAPNEGYCRD